MDGEQAHGMWVDRRRRQHAAGFEGAHKSIRRGVTSAAELQRNAQQGTQVRQHGFALIGGHRRGEARKHVAMGVDGLQGVVRRQLIKPAFPSHQSDRYPASILRE